MEEAFGNDPNLTNGLNQPEDEYSRMPSAPNPEAPSPLTNLRTTSGVNKDIVNSLKKKRKFYYYSLVFEVRFEHDDDTVFFAFSQPYTYSQVMADILDKEETLQPETKSDVQLVPRKVPGQNIKAPSKNDLPTLERQNTNPQQHPVQKLPTLQNVLNTPQ